MEFLRERVFTSLNADELRAGDKVIVANDITTLKKLVQDCNPITLLKVRDECYQYRFEFGLGSGHSARSLAYLVERMENCTNCGAEPCGYRANHDVEDNKINKCPLWFQPKTEKKYRPFKDVDELIGVWQEKCPSHNNREKALTMPLIWVRQKLNFSGLKGELITRFEDSYVDVNGRTISLHALFTEYEFLDGSPCGVEEC